MLVNLLHRLLLLLLMGCISVSMVYDPIHTRNIRLMWSYFLLLICNHVCRAARHCEPLNRCSSHGHNFLIKSVSMLWRANWSYRHHMHQIWTNNELDILVIYCIAPKSQNSKRKTHTHTHEQSGVLAMLLACNNVRCTYKCPHLPNNHHIRVFEGKNALHIILLVGSSSSPSPFFMLDWIIAEKVHCFK